MPDVGRREEAGRQSIDGRGGARTPGGRGGAVEPLDSGGAGVGTLGRTGAGSSLDSSNAPSSCMASSASRVMTMRLIRRLIGLFGSLPSADGDKEKRLRPINGMMPNPARLPQGCKFAERCPHVMPECRDHDIAFSVVKEGHSVRCSRSLRAEEAV